MPLLARSPHRCFRAVHSAVVSLVLCSVALHEVSATYEAWLGATPRFTYADREPASTMTVAWADGVSWPATVPRHVRQPNMFTPEQRTVLVDLFRGGPWGVGFVEDDGKGFVWVSRLGDRSEPQAPGVRRPPLLTPAQLHERVATLLTGIGFPTETLCWSDGGTWSNEEPPVGDLENVGSGVAARATVGGFRLMSKISCGAEAEFDREGRPYHVSLVWRKTVVKGRFRLADRATIERAILTGKARTMDFGFHRQLMPGITMEQAAAAMAADRAARARKAAGLPPLPPAPPPVVARRIVVREAEIALMDYAGLEHPPPWDDEPRFDDALRPLLVLTVELFAGEEPPVRGRLTLPADGFWHRREAQREDRRRGPRRL